MHLAAKYTCYSSILHFSTLFIIFEFCYLTRKMGSTWSSSGQQPPGFAAATTAEEVLAKFPDGVRGKTALVTGANSGIGKETARVLALGGATVLLASRNETLGQDAVKEIQVRSKNRPALISLS